MAPQKQSAEQNQNSAVTVFVAITAMGALMLLAFFPSWVRDSALGSLSGPPVIDSSLARLSSSGATAERLAAAHWLGANLSSPSSNALESMSRSLADDSDPAVRSAVANAFKQMAVNNRETVSHALSQSRSVEPQILEILETAYARESNASVRRCIVEAAGSLTYAEAAYFLARAEGDSDPAVQEAARDARIHRESRDNAPFKPGYLK